MNTLLRLDPAGAAWLPGLLTHLWQSTVVAAAMLGLLALARGLPARTRQALGWGALVKFAVPVNVIAEAVARWGGAAEWAEPVATVWLPVAAAGGTTASVPAAGPGLGAVLAGVWGAGVLLVLGFWIQRARRVRRELRAEEGPATPELAAAVARAAARAGLRRAPVTRRVGAEAAPGVVGAWRPVLVVPRGLPEALTAAELDAVLLHECVHLRRRDTVWAAARAALATVFWFHPLVWVLHRRVGLETEQACDERVVELTGEAEIYARALVGAVRHALGATPAGYAAATTPPVVVRLRAILALPERRARPWASGVVLAAATAVLGLSGRAGAVGAQAAETKAETKIAVDAVAAGASASQGQKPRRVVGEVTMTSDAMTTDAMRATANVGLFQRGVPFDEVTLDRSVRALYATGQFESIEARTQLVDGATVNVTYVVRLKVAARGEEIPGLPAVGDTFEIGGPKTPAVLAAEALAEAQRTVAKTQTELAALREARAAALARQGELEAAAERARVAAGGAEKETPRAASRAAPGRSIVAPIITAPVPPRTGYTAPVIPITQLDQRPVARLQTRPRYPYQLRKNGVAGEAVVDFVVDAEGNVAEPVAVRMTHEDFGAAAVDAVRRWQFKPGMKDGRPVATQLQVPIVFTLNEN